MCQALCIRMHRPDPAPPAVGQVMGEVSHVARGVHLPRPLLPQALPMHSQQVLLSRLHHGLEQGQHRLDGHCADGIQRRPAGLVHWRFRVLSHLNCRLPESTGHISTQMTFTAPLLPCINRH